MIHIKKELISAIFLLLALNDIYAQTPDELIEKFRQNKKVTGFVTDKKGVPTFIRGNLTPEGVAYSEGPEEKVYKFFEENRHLFKMNEPREELVVSGTEKDELGMTHVKMRQLYQDLEVYGAEMISHISAAGELITVNGEYTSEIKISVIPLVSAKEAAVSALNDISDSGQKPEITSTRLVAFPFEEKVILTWLIKVSLENPSARWEYFVDATNGSVVYKADRVKYRHKFHERGISGKVSGEAAFLVSQDVIGIGTGVMGDIKNHIDTYGQTGYFSLTDRTRRANNNIHGHNGFMAGNQSIETIYSYSSVAMSDTDNVWISASQAPGVDAHVYAGFVYDYLLSQFGRNSYDNLGHGMLSAVEDGSLYNNASWNGSRVTYYVVTSGHRSMAGAIDIVAHEWAHAVTEYESNLIYEKEPGALNESFSDMIAIAVGFATGIDPDWQQGENSHISGSPVRDLSNPHAGSTPQPDTYLTDTYWRNLSGCVPSGDNDWCYVHYNSGVPNKMFYLLSQGGTHNGVTVTGIGISNAIKIMYRANSWYWTTSTGFINAKQDCISAATDLDASGNWATQTKNAWDAVNVGYQSCIMDVSANSVNFSGAGETSSVSLQFYNCPNPAWTAVADVPWLTINPLGGTGNQTISLTPSANNSCSSRKGQITITSTGAMGSPKIITIAQSNGMTTVMTVTPSSQNVPETAGNTNFTISDGGCSTMPWTVTRDASWLTVTPDTGTGSFTITVTYSANIACIARTAKLFINATGITGKYKVVQVVQAAGNVPPYLSVSPKGWGFSCPSGTATFDITNMCGTVTWTASSDANWLTVKPEGGTGNQKITAAFTANTLCTSRTANITVSTSEASDSSEVVHVTQTSCGTPILTVSPVALNVCKPSGSATISIQNTGCGSMLWTVTDDTDWLKFSPENGSENKTVILTYSENASYSSRTATITVSAPGAVGSPQSFQLIQSGNETPVLTVSPTSQYAECQSGTTTFNISQSGCGNISWSISDDAGWLTVYPASGTGGQLISALFQPNTSGSIRTATITITANGAAGSPFTVHVTQAKCNDCAVPWQPVQNQLNNMTVIGNLYLNNVLSMNPNDAVAAFAGQECRGIGHPDPQHGGVIFLKLVSDLQSGEILTFKGWNSATCEECAIAETVPFISQSEMGTMSEPFGFHCGAVRLCIPFAQGYNWFSVNVNPGSMSLNDLFGNLTPCANDRIIGQTSFASWYSGQWIGSLTSIDPKLSYKMRLCSPQEWCRGGFPAECHSISIPQGFTWIGFCPLSESDVNYALAGLTPQPCENDRIISQNAFSTWYSQKWIGSLDTLKPGNGYIIKLCNSSTLTYPSATGNFSSGKAAYSSDEIPGLKKAPIIPYMQYNMQIIGNIILPDGRPSINEKDIIYAYAGNACRGFARPVKGLDGRLFLTIQSDVERGDILTFKVLPAEENRIYDICEKLVFSSEKELGTMEKPFLFTLSSASSELLTWLPPGIRIGEIYPNPLNRKASLQIFTDEPGHLEGKILNSLGQVVRSLTPGTIEEGSKLIEINGTGLSKGFYSVIFTFWNQDEKLTFSRKIIIK